MTGYLLDTNVLSETLRKKPAKSVMDRLQATPADALFTRLVTRNVRHLQRVEGVAVENWW